MENIPDRESLSLFKCEIEHLYQLDKQRNDYLLKDKERMRATCELHSSLAKQAYREKMGSVIGKKIVTDKDIETLHNEAICTKDDFMAATEDCRREREPFIKDLEEYFSSSYDKMKRMNEKLKQAEEKKSTIEEGIQAGVAEFEKHLEQAMRLKSRYLKKDEFAKCVDNGKQSASRKFEKKVGDLSDECSTAHSLLEERVKECEEIFLKKNTERKEKEDTKRRSEFFEKAKRKYYEEMEKQPDTVLLEDEFDRKHLAAKDQAERFIKDPAGIGENDIKLSEFCSDQRQKYSQKNELLKVMQETFLAKCEGSVQRAEEVYHEYMQRWYTPGSSYRLKEVVKKDHVEALDKAIVKLKKERSDPSRPIPTKYVDQLKEICRKAHETYIKMNEENHKRSIEQEEAFCERSVLDTFYFYTDTIHKVVSFGKPYKKESEMKKLHEATVNKSIDKMKQSIGQYPNMHRYIDKLRVQLDDEYGEMVSRNELNNPSKLPSFEKVSGTVNRWGRFVGFFKKFSN